MKTVLLLMVQFEKTVIPLEEICEDYFGCQKHTAIQKAKSGNLPVPAFKCSDSQKSTWMVHIEDLANMVDLQREQAHKDWLGAR